jgi:hypothetical protein
MPNETPAQFRRRCSELPAEEPGEGLPGGEAETFRDRADREIGRQKLEDKAAPCAGHKLPGRHPLLTEASKKCAC